MAGLFTHELIARLVLKKVSKRNFDYFQGESNWFFQFESAGNILEPIMYQFYNL